MTEHRTWIDRLFTVAVHWIVDVLSLLTLILLICATGLLAYGVYDALFAWEEGKLREVAVDIFTALVFIEVANLFRQFRHGQGIAIREVIEISFLVVMRELIIKNAEGVADPLEVFGYAAILATLSVAWWLVQGPAARNSNKDLGD